LDEFRKGVHAYEPKIAQLAEAGVDVINPSGAPPFMVLGYRGEQRLIEAREKKYQTAIFPSGPTTLDALRALSVRRLVGATYFRGDINKIYARYFADAGFDVLDMAAWMAISTRRRSCRAARSTGSSNACFWRTPRRRRSTCSGPR